MPPEETVNTRCETTLIRLAAKGVPLMCYSPWLRNGVLSDGGTFFTHYVTGEGKWLWIGGERQRLTKFDAGHFEAPIMAFVEKHEEVGLRTEEENRRVVTFEIKAQNLLDDQQRVYRECEALMKELVKGSDEFIVDRYDAGLAIFRPMYLAFERANAVLGWQDRVHLVITEEQGEQSLHKGATVSLCVKEGRRIGDANALADILEWIMSLFS
jgi:hypothetical protein